jgi:CubicO group peptidase (beta-lactamase class C family)
MKKLFVLLFIILMLFFVSCKVKDLEQKLAYNYTEPPDRFDGWESSTLSAQGIDVSAIEEMIENVLNGVYKDIHSITIARNGKLVLAEYFFGTDFMGSPVQFDWYVYHTQMSVTKSFTSALIGIAFDLGLLTDIDTPLRSFFPEYPDIDWSGGKSEITLKHLLTMSAGLDWDEWSYSYTDPRNIHTQMNDSPDQIKFVLNRPMAYEPGTVFVYNSGLTFVLGEIIRKVSSLPADEFAYQYLFFPMGIEHYYWIVFPNGVIHTGGGLYLHPRDMAKLGQLYLNGGTWNGKRLISQQWIDESIKQHIAMTPAGGYGFKWWLEKHEWNGTIIDSYSALGWGGQYIYVFPELELVVTFTGGHFYDSADPAHTMIAQYILPAVQ